MFPFNGNQIRLLHSILWNLILLQPLSSRSLTLLYPLGLLLMHLIMQLALFLNNSIPLVGTLYNTFPNASTKLKQTTLPLNESLLQSNMPCRSGDISSPPLHLISSLTMLHWLISNLNLMFPAAMQGGLTFFPSLSSQCIILLANLMLQIICLECTQ